MCTEIKLHTKAYRAFVLYSAGFQFPPWFSQDDVAQKQKLKDEKKALEQAKAKAAQKGPMGRNTHT